MLKRLFFISLMIFIGSSAFAQKVPIPVLTQKSAELTTLSAPGATPFHLKAAITIKQHPNYQAVIEEDWISPSKWRKTIKSHLFSQTIIVNGDKRYEKNEGEYFHVGLQTLSEALFQPIPDEMQESLKQSKVKLNLYDGALGDANICDSNTEKTGTPPTQGSIFSAICFSDNPSIISEIRIPFYDVKFKDRQPFGKLFVARKLMAGEDDSLEWNAQVTELSAITDVNESLFVAPENTPEDHRFKLFYIGEKDFRNHFKDTPKELILPITKEENKTGVLTVFISLDTNGYVSEAWTTEHWDPAISDAACKEVGKWQFGETKNRDHIVQLETYLTFSYKTQLAPKETEKPASPK
jgi:hypothetical protein